MDINRFLDFKEKRKLIIDVIIWFISGFILLSIGKSLENLLRGQGDLASRYIIIPPETVKVAVFFLLLVLLFVLIKSLRRWIEISINKNKAYRFNSKDWPCKWIFNGRTGIVDDTYLCVKSSRAGSLLKDHYWKDFKISFEMKFITDNFRNEKQFGLIFRAEDLDNYFMLEIGEDAEEYKDKSKKAKSSIKPHVRFKEGWELMDVEEITPSSDFSEFVKVSLGVKEDTAQLFYNNVPIFRWVLPTHVDVNHVESGVKDNKEKTKDIIVGGAFDGHVRKIPFRLGYGQIGFRAHWNHADTLIRNLRIKPL